MNMKIWLITKREYLTRVRKKSFLVMTILAPLLIVLFYGLIFYFAINKDLGASHKEIFVSDLSGNHTGSLKNNDQFTFTYGQVDPADELTFLKNEGDYYGLLVLPPQDSLFKKGIKLYTKDQAGFSVVLFIESQLSNRLKNQLLKQYQINDEVIKEINTIAIDLNTIKITDKGAEESNVGASSILGYIGAIIIYMFIFIYGVQIMRGVIEEKSNRIIEVIISSVKPFELMMGKIIGIALVGLTQFTIWVIVVSILGGNISAILMAKTGIVMDSQQAIQNVSAQSNGELSDIIASISGFNFTYLIGMFIYFFIGGYLFYGALFAAIGSAVDNETDTQQFMLPITLPLIFALVIAQSAIMANPNGSLAFWLSVIPFTSPVVMMVRLPFEVPTWQILISMLSLAAGFVFTTLIAARIYRIGILMYGQKPSYKKIIKWLFSKD